jgi:hypothetical protein
MTFDTDIDLQRNNQPRLFESEQIDLSHIRVRPSEFARMMGCSKQAVSIWIRDGKVILGRDGRMDPAQAVAQLLKNSNPNQLRLKALSPLIRKQNESDLLIKQLQNKIETLTSEVSFLKDEVDFYEGSSNEYVAIFDGLRARLKDELDLLADVASPQLINAINRWLYKALEYGPDDLMIIDFLESSALGYIKEGEGDE